MDESIYQIVTSNWKKEEKNPSVLHLIWGCLMFIKHSEKEIVRVGLAHIPSFNIPVYYSKSIPINLYRVIQHIAFIVLCTAALSIYAFLAIPGGKKYIGLQHLWHDSINAPLY